MPVIRGGLLPFRARCQLGLLSEILARLPSYGDWSHAACGGDLFGFLSADLCSGLNHPLQVAFQDSCCGEGEKPASPGHLPKGCFTRVAAKGSDTASTAKENRLTDFLEMFLG